MKRSYLIYGTLAVVLIAVIVAIGLSNRNAVPNAASQAPIQSTLKVGDTAPEFSVPTNAGSFDLASVSTPVLLEVFATWCPHCQHETSILNDLALKYQGKIAMVAVSGSPYGMDGSTPESQADVNTFGQDFQVRYPLAFDPQLTVAHQYLLGGYPTVVLIRPNKKIAYLKDGEIPESDLIKQINSLL